MSIYEFNKEDAYRFARERGITTKKRGNELLFRRCPYCGEKTNDKETFAINLETGQFKCLRASCGAKGNMLTLAREFDFSLGTEVDEYFRRKRKYRDMSRYPRPEVRPPAVEFLEARGISERIAREYSITTQKDRDNIIVFPFFDEDGKMQFVKYRKADFDKERDKAKEWCEKDCKPILFGMDRCNAETSDTLILTEGQIDSLSVAEAGLPNAVSVPTGANGFTWVPYCWDFLARFKTLIVFGDCEKGHITLLDEMSGRFHGTVKHVREEDYLGCKDANDILRQFGSEAIREAVANAIPIENPRIKQLSSVKRKDWSDIPHFDSGIPSFDKLTGGLYLGQLVIITGQRGLGKSTFASQIGAFAIKAGYTTFFYSGELNDWQFQGWFERQLAGPDYINGRRAKNGFVRYAVNAENEHDLVSWYEDSAYIYDNGLLLDSEGTEEETLTETVKQAIRQYDCKVIFIDNLMTAMDDDGASDIYRMQTEFTKGLVKMAKAYEVLIILIAHPRKFGRTDAANELTNDDIAGSGNIPNLADVVMVYRKPTEKESKKDPKVVRMLSITKNRINGKEDDIPLVFDEASKRIAESEGDLRFTLGWEKQPEVYEQIELDDMEDIEF